MQLIVRLGIANRNMEKKYSNCEGIKYNMQLHFRTLSHTDSYISSVLCFLDLMWPTGKLLRVTDNNRRAEYLE
jgi:hypothetical protein